MKTILYAIKAWVIRQIRPPKQSESGTLLVYDPQLGAYYDTGIRCGKAEWEEIENKPFSVVGSGLVVEDDELKPDGGLLPPPAEDGTVMICIDGEWVLQDGYAYDGNKFGDELLPTEEWVFTMEDGTEVTKKVVVCP